MKFGLFGIGSGPCADPDVSVAIARAAEDAGLESLWTGEHVVLPDPQVPPSPAPPDFPMLDPAVVLSYLASATQTIRLASGIILLPQRNPLVLAKELASVDVLSKGRLIFGLGVGYLEAEFDALGVPFEGRGARADEYLDAMIALWSEPSPRFDGRYVSFSGVRAEPRPVQQPHPEIVVGGGTPPAYRRAVARANGWYGFAMDLDATQRSVAALERAAKRADRPEHLGSLSLSITPVVPLDHDTVKRFEDLGVERLIPMQRGRTRDQLLAFVEEIGELIAA